MNVKKEVVVAVFLGLIVGIFLAFVISRIPQIKKIRTSLPKKEITEIVPSSPPTLVTLNLFTPEDEFLSQENQILVKGETVPGSTILISSSENDEILVASSDGSFETKVVLGEGENKLIITSFTEKGEFSEERTIFYTKEKI